MPTFPSKEWCEAVVRLINGDPEARQAGQGWDADFGLVVEPERGKLNVPFVVHMVPKDGVVAKWKVLPDPDDLDELEPAYVARAPYSVWKGLIQGTLDPMEAVLKRSISMSGELKPVVERMKYRHIATRLFAQLETNFADE